MDSTQRFAALLAAPAGEAQLDELCGLLGAAIDPAFDPLLLTLMLDELADGCPPTFEGIMSALFASGRLHADVDGYHDVDNSLVHRVLQRGKGMPITLSVVAIEVGRRLGVAVEGVGLPGHFVVRCGDTYADPFGAGLLHDQRSMEAAWQTRTGGAAAAVPGAAWATCPPRFVVLRILNNLKRSLAAVEDDPRVFALWRLRAGVAEFADENGERRRALRHWN
jgi:regulator of sirC expression with transglutaminase-like and TPR domain